MNHKVGAALLLLAAFSTVQAQNACRTPNNQNGNCVGIKQCPSLLSLLQSPNNIEANRKYLRQSQCGYEVSNPEVCCPRQNGDGGGNTGGSPIDLLPNVCGQDLSNRIVGGSATELDEFPWLALLQYRSPNGTKLSCGGVLISRRYVLTAAHCIQNIPLRWRLESVRLGEHNLNDNPDCIPDGEDSVKCNDRVLNVDVEEQITHEGYKKNSQDRAKDIALLRLSRDVNPTNYIRPICLPINANVTARATVAGWGSTEYSSQSDIKLKVTLPIVDRGTCQLRYSTARVNLREGQICAGGETGKDSCRGDSGGPLMQRDRASDGTTRWTAIGVVSYGPTPCGLSSWPGVYTKVYDYIPWILSKLRP